LNVNDRDLLIAGGTVSIAAGTLAIFLGARSGMVASVLAWGSRHDRGSGVRGPPLPLVPARAVVDRVEGTGPTLASESPAASAKLLLPAPESAPWGTGRRYAEWTLHIDVTQRAEPVVTGGNDSKTKPVIEGLPFWRKQITRALAMPGDLEHFLRRDLGLATATDPPAQFGILLKAREVVTDIVSSGSIRSLPAPCIVPEFIGFVIADSAGGTREETAGKLVLDLSERILHLDGSPDEMSGLVVQQLAQVVDIRTGRDLPVLRTVVAMLDKPGAFAVTLAEIAARTGLHPRAVDKALDALKGQYVAKYQKLLTGGIPDSWHVTKVTSAARRTVGQWPAQASLPTLLLEHNGAGLTYQASVLR
jgi:hypothetical protein